MEGTVASANVWDLDWGDLMIGGDLAAGGSESPGIIFTHVSGDCAVTLLGHNLGLVAIACPCASPCNLSFLRVWCQGGWTSSLLRAPEVSVPKNYVEAI